MTMSRSIAARGAMTLPLAALLIVAGCTAPADRPATDVPRSTRYEDLTALFTQWRAFQKPKVVDGLPDYTAGAMAAQAKELISYQRRLAAIDPNGWPIPQQVDYQLVRAEMSGLDFDHRVLKPWANNPAFYVTVFSDRSDQPAREGPQALGAVELWSYRFPLDAGSAARVDSGIRTIPGLFMQARRNLVGTGKDLWVYGAKSVREQAAELAKLGTAAATAPACVRAFAPASAAAQTQSWRSCPRAMRHSWAAGSAKAASSRAANGRRSRSLAPLCAIRRCSCSTSPPRRWMPRTRPQSSRSSAS